MDNLLVFQILFLELHKTVFLIKHRVTSVSFRRKALTALKFAYKMHFLLNRCGSKQGEEDYRPLFENFIQDLLSTVNKPEWPAAELLLSLLGRLLVRRSCF